MQHIADTPVFHEDRILEAIDQLRRRKARPDSDRICNYLLKKYAVDAKDTISDLKLLIEKQRVIQVDYKGNTSYRNALKWPRLQLYKNRPDAFVREKLNSTLVSESFAELLVEEPDYLEQGVPSQRLIEQLIDNLSSPMSRKTIDEFLVKEVASGNLAILTNGNYSLVSDNDKNNRRYSSETSSDDRSNTNKTSIQSGNSPEYQDDNHDSRQQSPTSINNDIFHHSKENDLSEETNNYLTSSYCNINKQLTNDLIKRDSKEDNNNCYSNLKRSSKSERKQRLQVRADDSMDLQIDYEEFERTANSLEESLLKNSYKKIREEQYNSDDNKDDDDEAGRSSTNTSPTPSNKVSGASGVRSARRKRARKVFDPSDNNVVKRKRGRQSSSIIKSTVQQQQEPVELSPKINNNKDRPNRQCSICGKDKSESLVACRDCTVRAHPSCIYSPEELLQKIGYGWQCKRCKTCVICCETSESGNLVSCINCNDAYHNSCHVPKIPSKSSTKWKCGHCSDKFNDKPEKTDKLLKNKEQKDTKDIKDKEIKDLKLMKELKEPLLSIITSRPDTPTNPSTLPPVLSPQVSPSRSLVDGIDLLSRDTIDPNIPDASDWTSEQVYQYFARLFGPKEVEVFRNQDIDGHALLLMSRSDVLSGLDLLLGPALKIYRHVLKLQLRRDDTKFYWL